MRAFDRLTLALRGCTLGDLFDHLERIHGRRILVEEADGGLHCTYSQAARRVREWAGSLVRRVAPGERVVLATPNSYEMFLLSLAVSRAGAVPVPVNQAMTPAEVRHVIRDSGAAMVVRSSAELEGGDALVEAVSVDRRSVAALFYTSGTTGRPKGVELTHSGLLSQIVPAALWPTGLRRNEAVVSLPIAHIMGFSVLLGLATAGIPVYFLPSFRPDEVLEAIERRRATMYVGVPAMYRLLLEAGAAVCDLSSVRVWVSGADVMPPELADTFKKFGATCRLPLVGPVGEALFVEGYGMVETAGGVAVRISPPLIPMERGPSLGVPLPGYRVRVVDPDGSEVTTGGTGELQLKGPGLLRGYWRAPDATQAAFTADGWLRTGDLVRKGPFGTFSFVGRAKDVIINGGYTVYAVEVETVLEEHPDVAEAVVVGVPDQTRGEVPVAAVRLLPGASTGPDELLGWARERLAEYKAPVRVMIVDDLPRTGTEKVRRAAVRELFLSTPVG
ncbi:MAG: malonyl-CoA synthase [Acidimicrobiales bacterium]|nr:MAG: malonyl-CoA synthase [Acidimicrobiales bacterium]